MNLFMTTVEVCQNTQNYFKNMFFFQSREGRIRCTIARHKTHDFWRASQPLVVELEDLSPRRFLDIGLSYFKFIRFLNEYLYSKQI
jgi:hypothetical protein